MRIKTVSLCFLLFLLFQQINCQFAFAEDNTWSYFYYGPYNETNFKNIVQTADNGYAVLGLTRESFYSPKNCWLLRINTNGAVEWNKTIPLSKSDFLDSIATTADGGFVLAGEKDFSSVTNNINSLNGKGVEFWLVKIDKYGNIEWNNTYGGSWHEGARALISTFDGGYALAGYTWSFKPNGYWLVKTDGNGTLLWSKSYENTYGVSELIQTSDGGFALVGSNGPQVKLVKVDENGLEDWSTSFGNVSYHHGVRSIVETGDGGIVILCYAYTGLYEFVYSWLSKINSAGNLEWLKTFDGNYFSLANVSSGGFVLVGDSNSSNCLVRTDALANIQWVKPFDNLNRTFVSSVIEIADGFVFVGDSYSPTNGSRVVAIMRTDDYGNAPKIFSYAPSLGSTPTENVNGGLVENPILIAGMIGAAAILTIGGLVIYFKKFHKSN